MKNLYKTLALAAVAAVSMFSAQSASAQTKFIIPVVHERPDAYVEKDIFDVHNPFVGIDDDFDDEELPASTVQLYGETYARIQRALFVASLRATKESNVKLSEWLIKVQVRSGAEFGFTEDQVRYYLDK